MRVPALALGLATLAWGQSSTPTYWRFAPAEPALLIGLDWRQVALSKLAALPAGLDFVEEMSSLLVAVEPAGPEPKFLATASGRFNLTKLRMMAAAEGARTGRYRGVEFFSAGSAEVAVVDPQTVLVGDARSVRAAIDRGAAPAPRESALWRRAVELSAAYSVWAASGSLQAFQPAGAQSPFSDLRSFDGGVALHRGLELAIELGASSEESAEAIERLLGAAASPALRGLTVRRDGARLKLAATVETGQLGTGLKTMLAGGPIRRASLTDWMIADRPAAAPAKAAPPPPAPTRTRVIRITGLEEGTREIPFPSSGRQE